MKEEQFLKSEEVLYNAFEEYEDFQAKIKEYEFHEQLEYAEQVFFYQEVMNYLMQNVLDEEVANRFLDETNLLKKLYNYWCKHYKKTTDMVLLAYIKGSLPATHMLEWRLDD